MKYLVIAVALPLTLVVLALAYFVTPSVFAVRSAQGVTVHCEVLGDYPSSIERIEIIEERNRRMVWRVKARGKMFQLHKFDLVPGLNAGNIQPFWGHFQTEIPAQGSFELKPGIKYRASVCSADWLKLCRSTEFTL
jgi:hypothetical protein